MLTQICMYAHLIKHKCVCVLAVGPSYMTFIPSGEMHSPRVSSQKKIYKKIFICFALSSSLIPALTFAMSTPSAEYSKDLKI